MVSVHSGLTTKEDVQLRATLQSIHDERYRCADCLGKYRGRTDEEQMTEQMRSLKACEKPAPAPVHTIGVLKFRSCPGNYVRPKFHPWIAAFQQFEKGVMPFAGSYMEQPAKVIELFDTIRSVQNEYALDQAKAAEKKRPRGSSAPRKGVTRGR